LKARLRSEDVPALVLAAAIPLLFLHVRYQAHVAVGPLDVYGSDLAAAAAVLAALISARRHGLSALRPGRPLWIATTALLAFWTLTCFWRPIEALSTHLVTDAKVIEYALLAPATALVILRRRDLEVFLFAVVGWSVAATLWGLLQFAGIVVEFEGKRPGQREVSFLGIHDFAALSGMALAIGVAAVATNRRGRLVAAALAAGSIGSMLAASIFEYSGVFLAAALICIAGRRIQTLTLRRTLAIWALVAVTGVGVLALRSYDLSHFMAFLGIKPAPADTSSDVQTGSQRTMLGYIGVRIWWDHPILGVGFERSANRYQPYLADAVKRYPGQPAQAYPSPAHVWGVQNFWVQTLADTGIVGLALLLTVFGVGLSLAWRAGPEPFLAAAALGVIVVAAGTWNAIGIVAGVPLEAVTWLGLGLTAVARRGLT
jgi:O-antigen ligase